MRTVFIMAVGVAVVLVGLPVWLAFPFGFLAAIVFPKKA